MQNQIRETLNKGYHTVRIALWRMLCPWKKIANPVTADSEGEDSKKGDNWLARAFWSAIFVAIVLAIWPDTLPFTYTQLWSTKGQVLDWVRSSLPIFIWGIGVTGFFSLITRNKREENAAAESNFVKGAIISVWAGVMEEICFRWLIFMSAIIGAKIANFLFFGCLGFGITQWLQLNLLGPVANFFTIGILAEQLVKPENWAIGVGLLSANALFRDGHKYLGILGFINSWFIGMFMFYLLFTYGLVACILVHFLYDLFIFTVRYVDQVIERAQGN